MKEILLLGLPLGLCACCWAQEINVYSEFARIDASGRATAPETPREILSPGVVRNGFTSFQVVVETPAETKWWLFIGQNPENFFKVTLYKESGGLLEPVDLPYQSQGPQVFWLDAWTDGNAAVQRVKLEPELHIGGDWVTYPIEARVMDAMVPDGPPFDLENGSARSVWKLAGEYLCDQSPVGAESGPGRFIERWRARNVAQDVRLTQAYSAKEGARRLFGSCSAPQPEDPEWYLRIRDYLFRLR